MVIAFIGGIILFIFLYTLAFLFNAGRETINFFIMIYCGYGVLCTYIQFSEKCPNCKYRLGFSTSLSLPERCKKCGILYQSDNTNQSLERDEDD